MSASEWCHRQKSTVHAINNHFKTTSLFLGFLEHPEGISRPRIFLKNLCFSRVFLCFLFLSPQHLPFLLLKSPPAIHSTFNLCPPFFPYTCHLFYYETPKSFDRSVTLPYYSSLEYFLICLTCLAPLSLVVIEMRILESDSGSILLHKSQCH